MFMPQVKLAKSHSWNLTPEGATQLQRELASEVVVSPLADDAIDTVGGIDVGFLQSNKVARAAVVLFDYAALEVVDQAIAEAIVAFPYIPGLLSFREIPVILAALNKFEILPDLLLIDGHGYAHPRRFGLACHLGLILGKPAIGCAKSILVGKHGTLEKTQGSVSALVDGGEIVGAAVRTREAVKPVYVSVGYQVDLESAVRIVLNCCAGYRLPEPARWAHRLASK
jgi:deoxyribonuclease V